MKKLVYLDVLLLLLLVVSCQSQPEIEKSTSNRSEDNVLVGGACEGCEAIFEYGNKQLSAVDTLAQFEEAENKLKISGTVYQKDGKTAAPNVILYIYHTNQQGIYEKREGAKGWARRHGIFRGWIKTGKDGKYCFYSFRPGAYPNGQEPEHIHLVVKEPDKNAYYLDDYFFEDDPLLTTAKRNNLAHRGGSGIVKPTMENGILQLKRDIILGLNIPNY